jgi:anionic cell wall polymer biosynthesis LytR-Cps2A-Psr (LCP) family protein
MQQLAGSAACMEALLSAQDDTNATLASRVSQQQQVLKALLQHIISLQEEQVRDL